VARPRLTVSGQHIVDAETGRPVVLRGLNRSGLEYVQPGSTGFLASAGMSEREADAIVGWGATIVRVPLNQDRLLNGCGGWSAEDYASELDTLVSWYAARDAYVLFDLHWLDDSTAFGLNRDGTVNRVPPLPDASSAAALAVLASRYRGQPAVLYEIFNEPHTPIADPFRPERDDPVIVHVPAADGSLRPCARRSVTMAEWQAWAPFLVRAIRDVHPEAIVFVPGIDWAYDLRGMPLEAAWCYPPDAVRAVPAGANVVYSTHVYAKNGRARRGWRRSLHRTPGWDEAFGDLSSRVPVFVTEWGGTEANLEWGSELADYLDERQIGWTAWSWSDRPRLVRDAQRGDYTPTAFGGLVRAALAHNDPRRG
jgi:hypothetical protein